eukprot:jgi/Bigna1/130088/aug1.10_g4796
MMEGGRESKRGSTSNYNDRKLNDVTAETKRPSSLSESVPNEGTMKSSFIPNEAAGFISDAFKMTGHVNAPAMEETYYCHVCLCNKRRSEGYKLRACGHYYCRSCLSAYLSSQFQSRQTHPRCFFVDDSRKQACNTEIVVDDLKEVATPEAWKKYIYFMNKETNDNFIDCPKCKKQQIGDPKQPWMVCRSETCSHEFCFVHQNQHTKEITCADYEAKVRLEEKKNMAWESANTKKCPKCGVATEKNQGCNHMTCYV